MDINKKLSIVRQLQAQYAGSHIGGSLGLMIHGIDLKRDMRNADIDLTVQEDISGNYPKLENSEQASDNEDFDLCFNVSEQGKEDVYTKIDIKIEKSQFVVIEYAGEPYNVTPKDIILQWKQKYAYKGVRKHIDDMIVIAGGERPAPLPVEVDELPF